MRNRTDRPRTSTSGNTSGGTRGARPEDETQKGKHGGLIRPEFRSVLSFWRMDSCQDRIRTSSVSARCGC